MAVSGRPAKELSIRDREQRLTGTATYWCESISVRMHPIVYVYQDHYPWDVRVEKICGSLAQLGHDVTIVSRNRARADRDERLGPNLSIRRLRRGFGPISKSLMNFPAFFSPFWLREILRTSVRTGAEMVIVRDLPLGLTAYWAARLAGIPVVMDMAENYPAMIADTWRYGRVGPFDWIIRNPALLRVLEARTLPHMNGIIAVSEPSADRVRQTVSRSTHVWTVGNTPVLRPEQASTGTSRLADVIASAEGLRLLYIGGLEESRGLEVAIRALPIAQEKIGPTSLFIVGEGTSLPRLKRVATELGVERSTHFAGWIDPGKLPAVTASADICLVPHYVTEHIDTTIPNKIFDYMYAAKPVIVTHSRTLRQIVESTGCGEWYQDDRPDELADRIAALASANTRADSGARGRQAVLQQFNWKIDEQRLFDGLRRVHDRYFGGPQGEPQESTIG